MLKKLNNHIHWMLQRYRFHVAENKRFTDTWEATPEGKQAGRDSEIQYYSELHPNTTLVGIMLLILFYKVLWHLEMAYWIITGLEPKAWRQHCEEMSIEEDERLLSYAR